MAKRAPWTVRAPSFPPVSATEPNPYPGKRSLAGAVAEHEAEMERRAVGVTALDERIHGLKYAFPPPSDEWIFARKGRKLREDANGSPSIPPDPIQLSFGRFVEVTEFIGLGDETEQESTKSNPEEAT